MYNMYMLHVTCTCYMYMLCSETFRLRTAKMLALAQAHGVSEMRTTIETQLSSSQLPAVLVGSCYMAALLVDAWCRQLDLCPQDFDVVSRVRPTVCVSAVAPRILRTEEGRSAQSVRAERALRSHSGPRPHALGMCEATRRAGTALSPRPSTKKVLSTHAGTHTGHPSHPNPALYLNRDF